jgi:hypothetical protein
MEKRNMDIIFVKDYKSFIQNFGQKEKDNYVLNVSKLIKDKFSTKFIVPNKVQSFLLNYEIKKLLDKAITLKNDKYTKIVYLNSNLSAATILNTIDFIEDEYSDFKFSYFLVNSEELGIEDLGESVKIINGDQSSPHSSPK